MKGRKFIDTTIPWTGPSHNCRKTDKATRQVQNSKTGHQSFANRSCTLFGVLQQKQPLVRSQRQNIVAFSQLMRFYHTTLPGDKRISSRQLANWRHCAHNTAFWMNQFDDFISFTEINLMNLKCIYHLLCVPAP